MNDPIQRLILELGRLPGIGERSAARLAYYIVRQRRGGGPSMALDLAAALQDVDREVGTCGRCHNFSAASLCKICQDVKRDQTVLCVVESVADLRAIEQSGAFRGRYYVLHGALAPLDGVGPDDLQLDGLVARVTDEGCDEVIVATNATVEGDATALYIGGLLNSTSARVSRLASGVPMGGELEYLDQATLSRALSNRQQL